MKKTIWREISIALITTVVVIVIIGRWSAARRAIFPRIEPIGMPPMPPVPADAPIMFAGVPVGIPAARRVDLPVVVRRRRRIFRPIIARRRFVRPFPFVIRRRRHLRRRI